MRCLLGFAMDICRKTIACTTGVLPLGAALYCCLIGALSRRCPDRQPKTRAHGLSRWTQPRGSRTRSVNNSSNWHPMCQSLEQTKESRPSLTCLMQLSGMPSGTSAAFGSTRLSLIASLEKVGCRGTSRTTMRSLGLLAYV